MRSQSLILTSPTIVGTARFGQVRANNRTISKATCSSFFPTRVFFHAQSQVTGVDICWNQGTAQCSIHRPSYSFSSKDEFFHPTRTARTAEETPADSWNSCPIFLRSDICLVHCPFQLAIEMDSLRFCHLNIHHPLRRRQWSPHLAFL
jgi:hypothetical protein